MKFVCSHPIEYDPEQVERLSKQFRLSPTAVRTLGADIITHGVPAQPGNMTLVAYLGDIPVLGVPGAAISLPTTIFDVLLPQIFAGDKFTKEELYNLADGGLCQMCKVCHWPNCTFGRY